MAGQPKISAIDLYAGAGGLSLGLLHAGFDIEAAVEVDEWAGETYQANIACKKFYGCEVGELPDHFFSRFRGVDVVVGGPPCQGFSISAEARRGKNDPRNEQVIRFTESVLLVPLITNVLLKAGYRSAHWLLDSVDFGVPQRRKRFFLIAGKGAMPNLFDWQTHGDETLPLGMLKPHITVEEAISDLPAVEPDSVPEDAYSLMRETARRAPS